MTYYDYVKEQIQNGTWIKTQAAFGRNAIALDFYFRVYQLVTEFYPGKPYGYAERFVRNELVLNKLGGGIRRI